MLFKKSFVVCIGQTWHKKMKVAKKTLRKKNFFLEIAGIFQLILINKTYIDILLMYTYFDHTYKLKFFFKSVCQKR